MTKVKSYKKHLLKQLEQTEEAAAYLSAALQDDNPQARTLALQDLAQTKKKQKRARA
jgi:DNA-binding phage protein